MEDQPGRRPSLTAEEAERRKAVLAQRHKQRDRRRWITGLSVVGAAALVSAGAAVAWNSQAHAELAAAGIEQWREDRDAAECALTARVIAAIDAEDGAREVLPDARSIVDATGIYADADRAAFAEEGLPALQAMAGGAILDDADRERAAAAGADGDAFDVEACVAAARAQHAPVGEATAERADALARQWRSLGDPADVDDERVVEFEASLERVRETAVATAASRTEVAALRSSFEAAPAESFDRLDEVDARLADRAAADAVDADDVFELVELLADRVAAARDAEALALAAAAAEAEEEAAVDPTRPAPPAIVRPGPARPVPPPAGGQPAAPIQPGPAPVPEPAPQPQPEPSIPTPPEVTQPQPDPGPVVPPPVDPPVDPPVQPAPPPGEGG